MNIRSLSFFALSFVIPLVSPAQTVEFQTTLGNIDVVLLPNAAPKTVANFLRYVDSGAYNKSIIHRSIPGFIIQGGGYVNPGPGTNPTLIPTFAPVPNEFSISNTRGTLAMAKLSNDPNSATSQWFFNLGDNSSTLDAQNGGFTVFGKVANSASLAVMDKIAAVPTCQNCTESIPLLNGGDFQAANFIYVNAIVRLAAVSGPPVINPGGVISASAFGAYTSAAPGSFLEIYGTNLSATTREWATADFNGNNAPTSLDGVTVTVGGQAAYVRSVSPGQVNVQVPAGVAPGAAVPVVVTYNGQSSAPVNIAINARQPGLLAPASFVVNNVHYVVAFHADGTFVTNGNIAGVNGSPAAPGETIVIYGLGFGGVNEANDPVAGQIVQGLSTLASPVVFNFQQIPGTMLYAGFAPGYVGLDQFNVKVPDTAPTGDLALTVTSGGTAVPQTLYIPVKGH